MSYQKQSDRLTLRLDSTEKLRSGGLSSLISQLVKPVMTPLSLRYYCLRMYRCVH